MFISIFIRLKIHRFDCSSISKECHQQPNPLGKRLLYSSAMFQEIQNVMQGKRPIRFISDVLLDSTEEEIQQEIYEVLHSTGPKLIAPKDFKIIDVNYIIGRVFNREEGSELSGCTIKQMVGTGAIYVWFLKHYCLIA